MSVSHGKGTLFAFGLQHDNQLTAALRSGIWCWPWCVCAHSITRDRHGVVESEPVVATERCPATRFIAISFCHDTVLGRVGVRARALSETAATAGCGAVPGDGASESGVARACSSGGVVGIRDIARSRCGNKDNMP